MFSNQKSNFNSKLQHNRSTCSIFVQHTKSTFGISTFLGRIWNQRPWKPYNTKFQHNWSISSIFVCHIESTILNFQILTSEMESAMSKTLYKYVIARYFHVQRDMKFWPVLLVSWPNVHRTKNSSLPLMLFNFLNG